MTKHHLPSALCFIHFAKHKKHPKVIRIITTATNMVIHLFDCRLFPHVFFTSSDPFGWFPISYDSKSFPRWNDPEYSGISISLRKKI